DRRVLEQRPQRLVPAALDLGIEVAERDEPPRGRLGAAVAAGAEADVLREAKGPRARPVGLDALPAAVGRAGVGDDPLDLFGSGVPRERAERGRQDARAVVVDEHDRELHQSSLRATRQYPSTARL